MAKGSIERRFRLSDEIYQQLSEVSKESGVSVSKFVAQAVQEKMTGVYAVEAIREAKRDLEQLKFTMIDDFNRSIRMLRDDQLKLAQTLLEMQRKSEERQVQLAKNTILTMAKQSLSLGGGDSGGDSSLPSEWD